MNRPFISPTTKALFVGVFALCLATTAGATAYYWKGGSSWADYNSLFGVESFAQTEHDTVTEYGKNAVNKFCFLAVK